jgi:hypothetical protein
MGRGLGPEATSRSGQQRAWTRWPWTAGRREQARVTPLRAEVPRRHGGSEPRCDRSRAPAPPTPARRRRQATTVGALVETPCRSVMRSVNRPFRTVRRNVSTARRLDARTVPAASTRPLRSTRRDPAVRPVERAGPCGPAAPRGRPPPTPLSATSVVPPGAADRIRSDADRAPETLGAKRTRMTQLSPAARPVSQVVPAMRTARLVRPGSGALGRGLDARQVPIRVNPPRCSAWTLSRTPAPACIRSVSTTAALGVPKT